MTGFTIPDKDEAAFPIQSGWFQSDIDALAAAYAGTGVLSGCSVTAQGSPDMTVAVASGEVTVAGARALVSAGNVTVTNAHATLNRLDLVVVDAAGAKSVVAGTAAASPIYPAVPASSVVLAGVYVPAADTDIDANQIVDKRVLTVLGTQVTQDVARMVVYGHSLAFGGGASDTDRDITTHLASMLKMRELPRAVGGAVAHWHQTGTGGDGGYAHLFQTDLRARRPSTTLSAGVTAGVSSTIPVASGVGIKDGDLISVGTGDPSGSGGEVLYVIGGGGTTTLSIRRADSSHGTTVARSHSSGQMVYVVPSEYVHLNPFYLIWYGLNDLGAWPITSALATHSRRFTEAIRSMIARAVCAEVFEDGHTSAGFAGSTTQVFVSGTNSGVSVRRFDAVAAAVTIHVPDNFPGGTVVASFISGAPTNPADVATWDVIVDGVTVGTVTAPNMATGKFSSFCKRITGLSAGRHAIAFSMTNVGTSSGYFDWWGIESTQPPLVAVPKFNRPFRYGLWNGSAIWLNQQRSTTLTGTHGIGTSSFTVASSANMLPGQTVTFELGTGNAETLEINTVPNGTTITTTTASAISHAGGTAVLAGIQDADIAKANTLLQGVVDEFGTNVFTIDFDGIINKDVAYFWHDGAHFNDRGHAVLTEAFFHAIRARLTSRMASYTAVPTAPLPSAVSFVNSNEVWTNLPAGLTELFGVAAHRKLLDLRRCYEARFVVGVRTAGTSGSGLRVQYSIDGGTSWLYLFRTATYAEDTTHEALLTTTGMKDSGWRPLAADALADGVWVRIVGINGGTGDPVFGTVDLYFR